jgi:cytosine/adenosine deaminase-related metal-dependent hydrolase
MSPPAQPAERAVMNPCDEAATCVYRARWVVPVEGAPIREGALAVRGGRVVAVGPSGQVAGGAVHDLGDGAIFPGFVNAHTHLELSRLRGRVAPGPLFEWFDRLLEAITAAGEAGVCPGAVREGAALSLASGVTCVGDISRTGLHAAALRDSPIRKVCFFECISGARLPPFDAASLEEAIDAAGGLVEEGRLHVGVSPHSLYSVDRSDVAAIAALAVRRRLPLTLHFLETLEEQRWFHDSAGAPARLRSRLGLSGVPAWRGGVVEVLEACGLLEARPLLAHVNYIDDAALARLGKRASGVVFCPRSHRFFGHSGHRWRDMLSLGFNVCLGTDSLASNTTLSILDELRFLAGEAGGAPPALLLEMATLRGAAALGLGAQVGSLRPGKHADFVAIGPGAAGAADPVDWLLHGSASAVGTWVGGRRVAGGPEAGGCSA